jgi:Na+/melibiose symporter-like transporter
MDWAWIVFISLCWVTLLYYYAYLLGEDDPQSGVFTIIGYIVLYALWPAIVLWFGLINVSPAIWIVLVIETVCLFFLPILVGEKLRKEPRRNQGMLEEIVATISGVILMVVAPIGLIAFCADFG